MNTRPEPEAADTMRQSTTTLCVHPDGTHVAWRNPDGTVTSRHVCVDGPHDWVLPLEPTPDAAADVSPVVYEAAPGMACTTCGFLDDTHDLTAPPARGRGRKKATR